MKGKSIAVWGLVVALMLGLTCLVGCGSKAESTDAAAQTANLKIDATAAVEEGFEGEGIIFEGAVEIPEGGTVTDALTAADLLFQDDGGYVSSIAGLAAGAYGEQSGWTYTVNGEYPTEGDAVLQDGDTVEFLYVLTFDM